jgi:chitinase
MRPFTCVFVIALVLAACSGGQQQSFTPNVGNPRSSGSVKRAASATPTCAPAWQENVYYPAGTVVSYNGDNYTALVNQTDYSGTGYNPTVNTLWQNDGSCGSGGPSPSPSPSGSPSHSPSPSPSPSTKPSPTPSPSGNCYPAWNASTAYNGGAQVSYNGVNYTAAYWTQNQNPSTNNGPAGSGQPWISDGPCGGGTPSPSPSPSHSPSPSPSPSGPPPSGFIFSQYKDTSINMNWNTNVISTDVTGSQQPLVNVMPSHNSSVTLAFATGTCGSESWAGVSGSTLASANMQSFVSSGKYYIISTGGANGVFTCPSTSGFLSFIQTYYTSHMLGVDFDIEGGQSQSDIDNLVADVQAAESSYPNMRFSFTIATLGGNANPALNTLGIDVVNSIKSHNLGGNYTINLMTMDYGSASSGNCVVVNGACEMGQSAVQAAKDLNSQEGIPYSRIELTPMIGGNDTQGETFTISDAQTVSSFVRSNGLAGVHFWSFDRDVDCPPGSASPTCNSYGQAGTLGFTNAFISDLGL